MWRGTGQTGENPWLERIEAAKVGTAREQVERLLPPYQDLAMPLRRLGYQVVRYWVDENWFVTATYDYTGAVIDEKRQIRRLDSPYNRLLRPIEMEWRPRHASRVRTNIIKPAPR